MGSRVEQSYLVWAVPFAAHSVGGARPGHGVWEIPECVVQVAKTDSPVVAVEKAARIVHVRAGVVPWLPFLRETIARAGRPTSERVVWS